MIGSRWPFSTAADSPISGLRGEPLLESDYQMLDGGGISREIADGAFLLRVDSPTGKEMMGRNDHHNYAGIVIPNIKPGTSHVRAHRIRRDSPEIEDGKPRNKYVCAAGTRNMLYFFPGTPVEHLLDIHIPIYLTEGEKKAMALFGLQRLGLSNPAERPHFLPIAISGVNNWRGKIGICGGPNGEKARRDGADT